MPIVQFTPTTMPRHLLLAAVLFAASAHEHENVVHVIAEQAPGLKRNARVRNTAEWRSDS